MRHVHTACTPHVCCRSPPPPQYDEAFLHKHARWQDALRAALAKADG
jgi:hypothetical protein